jgi:hypothetical protein
MDADARPDWLALTCRSAPTQMEGVSPDGDHVYFRFRWSVASVEINHETVWSEQYGHGMSGDMDPDLAAALVVAQLAARHGHAAASALALAAHQAARAALPVGPVPPLAPEEQALMDRWTATTTPPAGT